MKQLLPTLLLGALYVLPAVEVPDSDLIERLGIETPVEAAIRRGLDWLDGRVGEDGALTNTPPAVAVGSLAVMAHLAAGVQLSDRRRGPILIRMVRRILEVQDRNGYFCTRDASRMYGHGMACLMLAEALGTSGIDALEEDMRSALVRGVALTMAAGDPTKVTKQKGHVGGWRYDPRDDTSDLSLSGWQLLSLHASRKLGLDIDASVIDRAVAYARGLIDDQGRVGYQVRGQDHSPLRGLGLLCLAIGRREDEAVCDRIADRIAADPIAWQGPWFFYRVYYDAVGLSRCRETVWQRYRPHLETVLVSHQHADGFWSSPPDDTEAGQGRAYATSMAILALAVERRLLPAYQR